MSTPHDYSPHPHINRALAQWMDGALGQLNLIRQELERAASPALGIRLRGANICDQIAEELRKQIPEQTTDPHPGLPPDAQQRPKHRHDPSPRPYAPLLPSDAVTPLQGGRHRSPYPH
jgi:hypothetical protein